MATTRERLITATAELFRRQGYNGTSLKQVTVAAGAPMGSLYHHFPGGKAELTAEVITITGVTYRQLFEAIYDAAADPVTAVTDFFDGAAEALAETAYLDLCPIGTVAREVASTDDRLRQASDDVFRTWISAASSRFEAAGLQPAAAADLAIALVASIEGGFLLSRAAQSPEPLRSIGRVLRNQVAAALAEAPVSGG
ncbi:MAG: TetR/AcrR family transcriptional regulator [Acidimicrobiales bacterium]